MNNGNDKSDLIIIFKPKNRDTTSHERKDMVYSKGIMWRKATKIVDLVLGNNRKFDWKVALLIRIFVYESLKEHIGIMNDYWKIMILWKIQWNKWVICFQGHVIIITQ